MTATEHIQSPTEIDIDPANEAALGLLGVRYFLTSEGAPLYARLSSDPDFRLLPPATSFFKVFEFTKARLPYGWVSNGREPEVVRRVRWDPEAREFVVRSETGGRFALHEQFYPGWRATIDGNPIRIERWSEAFQSVQVPPGEHRIEFRFRSSGLRIGALVSLLATLVLVVVVRVS
jgi:hypothetical protein